MAKCEAARQQTVQAGVEARADVVQLNVAARQEVKQNQAEARAEAEARFGPGVILGASPADIEKLKGQPLPTVSAVCVQQ